MAPSPHRPKAADSPSGRGGACGSLLCIYTGRRNGSRGRLTTLPSGTNIALTSVKRINSSAARVYYDQSRCSTGASNIYRIRTGA